MTLETTSNIISGLLDLSNLEIMEPSKVLYESAVEDSRSYNIGINDALSFVLMKRAGILVVYSFDRDIDKLKDLKRITE
jgi:predicted nucleic acid-binding protein